MALSELDRAILDFERSWWQGPGPKGAEIRRQLGISPSRYYRRLAALVDTAEALGHDPLVVRRLRRLRERRRRDRFEGRSARPSR